MTHTFSLIDEPWISCSLQDGSLASISLRSLFDGTACPVEILGDSPTQDYAVLRVLLAVYWRAHRAEARALPGRTFDFSEWFDEALSDARSGGPDNAVLEYVERYADRFDLLDPVTPFMQVAALHTQKNTHDPVSRIIPDSEKDLFAMRAGQGRAAIPFADAARWVIHAQAYDYSGIKSGAVGDPRVKGGKGYPIGTGWGGMTGGTVILGHSLRETLVLNTVVECLAAGDGDRPVWEREPDGAQERPVPVPHGPSDLATWQSRRIRLIADGRSVTGVLVCNGDRIPDAGKNVMDDPMTPYRFSPNQTKKGQPPAYYARPYDTERMMWRSLEPLIAIDGEQQSGAHPPRRPQVLESVASTASPLLSSTQRVLDLRLISTAYGPQASSYGTSVDARIDLPRAVLDLRNGRLRRSVLDCARATQSAAISLGRFAGNLLVAAGGDYEFQPPATDAALTDLEPAFRSWLAGVVDGDLEMKARSWQGDVLALIDDRAQILLRGAGPKALIGREELVEGKPQIRSAGNAYRQLRHELKKALPLAAAHEKSAPASASASHSQQENRDD